MRALRRVDIGFYCLQPSSCASLPRGRQRSSALLGTRGNQTRRCLHPGYLGTPTATGCRPTDRAGGDGVDRPRHPQPHGVVKVSSVQQLPRTIRRALTSRQPLNGYQERESAVASRLGRVRGISQRLGELQPGTIRLGASRARAQHDVCRPNGDGVLREVGPVSNLTLLHSC